MAYLSVASCTIIILTAILLSLHPLSKQKTDRVSFRLMLYALAGSVVYSTATVIAIRVHGQTACRVSGSFSVFALQISSFFFFCIGLNLQLVMIYGIDGTRAEKYYFWGSLCLAIVLGVLTFESKQLVYSTTQSVCYYHDSNPVRGLWWRIWTQNLWNFATMAGEFVTFTSVVVYMIRVKVFNSGPHRGSNTTTSTQSQRISASRYYRKPFGPKQYRNVVLRIALYPLSSLATSGIMAIGTVYRPTKGIASSSDLKVMSALRIVYQARGAVYALVAAADPAITQGLKVLYGHYVRGQTSSSSNGVGIVAVHSVVARPSDGIELEELAHSKNEILRRPSFRESKTDLTLPSIPRPAVLSAHGAQVTTSWSYTCTSTNTTNTIRDAIGGSQIGSDGVQFSYPELRQL
ncbi:hypothetical protein E1B28_007137 [Marasmius oreades]|uniref:G-protein coupled receptors family 2 profile 2 domain-containing protein n=1 Tax=Marasmius oreades TaxID=181124 RepID=A0A9P7S126_9AGAR|nr:uncharacterized protein E1B28_007137 [Marasmius oreades]KAG7093461.1 hypothetical protein E1B28_007137 [Marasmius oreades]